MHCIIGRKEYGVSTIGTSDYIFFLSKHMDGKSNLRTLVVWLSEAPNLF
jgi:hypothetical protein